MIRFSIVIFLSANHQELLVYLSIMAGVEQLSRREKDIDLTRRHLVGMGERARDRFDNPLGPFHVISVGNVGFLVERLQQPLLADQPTLLLDFDDSIGATTVVKQKRLRLYTDYIRKMVPDIADDQIGRVMKMTDAFARWKDREGGDNIYHVRTHAVVLDWVSRQVEGKQADVLENTIAQVATTLGRIKGELTGEGVRDEASDPFYFRQGEGRLIITNKNNKTLTPWSKEIGDIFVQTMITPPYYPEVLDAVSFVQELSGENELNIGVCTSGDPIVQLHKILMLLHEHPDLPINQMCLTQVPKGDFARALANMGLLRKNGKVLFDDSREQIVSFLSVGGECAAVLSKRAGTKYGNDPVSVPSAVTVVDFDAGPPVEGKELGKIWMDAIQTVRRRVPDTLATVA